MHAIKGYGASLRHAKYTYIKPYKIATADAFKIADPAMTIHIPIGQHGGARTTPIVHSLSFHHIPFQSRLPTTLHLDTRFIEGGY